MNHNNHDNKHLHLPNNNDHHNIHPTASNTCIHTNQPRRCPTRAPARVDHPSGSHSATLHRQQLAALPLLVLKLLLITLLKRK